MNNFIVKSNKLTANDTSTLSILISQNGLSYYIWTEENNTIEEISFTNTKEDYGIENFLKDNNLLNKKFKNVFCSYAVNKATIIPQALYSEEKKEKIFSLNFNFDKDKELLFSNKCEQTKNIILFSIDKKNHNEITAAFPEAKIFSSALSFIQNSYLFNKLSLNRNTTKVFLQFFYDYFEIAVIKEEKIFLFNTYKFKSDNDIIYYIMNIFEQLKLSQDESEIMISGFIEKTNSAIFMLKKFLRLVYFSPIDTSFRYNYHYTEQQPHYLYYFINNLKCV